MKLFVVALLLFIGRPACAQTAAEPDTLVWSYELPRGQRVLWDSLYEPLRKQYRELLRKAGVIPNCANCGRVSLSMQIEIGADGKMQACSILQNNIYCGRKSAKAKEVLYDGVRAHFEKLVFPAELRGRKIAFQAGVALKC